MTARWLDPERTAWLQSEYPRRPVAETCRLFNAQFGTDVDPGRMRAANKRCRFGRAPRTGMRIFSKLEQAWLRENLVSAPRREIAAMFETAFGRPVTVRRLAAAALAMNLRGAPNAGRFRKGHVPHNKDRKGFCAPGSERSWFKKGHVGTRTRPLWSERWDQRKGARILMIKIPRASRYDSLRRRGWGRESCWIRKAMWVWMEGHGDVPDGHAVIHLDGDPANCALDNLACVPRAALAVMNAPHAPSFAGTDANPARVARALLLDRIGRVRREGRS